MAVNPGKRFENDFQKSIDRENIFLHRLKDGSTRTGANGEMVRLKNRNLCDFILYKDGQLVLVELKSFLGKSMAFSNIKSNVDEQMTFLYDLQKETEKNGVKAYMVLNFRDLEETYAVPVGKFYEHYKNTTKASINISEVKEIGILLAQEKKRISFKYNINSLFEEETWQKEK